MKNTLKNYLDNVEKEFRNKCGYTSELWVEYSIEYGIQDVVKFYGETPYKIVEAIIRTIDKLLEDYNDVRFEHSIRLDGSMGVKITINIYK